MKSYSKQIVSGRSELLKNKNCTLESLVFELTERCTNNCIHCYINKPKDDQESKNKELSASEITNILIEAATLGCMEVRFTGGEPLLRDDFEAIYMNARKLGMMVEIYTNAILLTPQLVNLFVKIPPKKKIIVTVYGLSREAYEAVSRVQGSHKAAFRGIDRLEANKVPYEISTPILPQNEHEVERMESWITKLKGSGHPSGAAMYLSLHARHEKKKTDLIKKNRIPAEESLDILIKNKTEYVEGAKIFFFNNFSSPDDKLFTCGAGIKGGCVDAYGKFQMCTMLRSPDTVYDLKKGSLRDALSNFFPEVRKKRAKNPKYLSRCAKCFLKSFCDHCPAQSYSAHVSLDDIDEYFCEVAHAEARYLGLIAENEKAWEVQDWRRKLMIFTGKTGMDGKKNGFNTANKEKRNGKECDT